MSNFMDKFECVIKGLNYTLISIVALTIAFFALSIPLNILFVRIGIGAISWLNEFIEYVLYAGIFLGAPYVLSQNSHVRVDMFITSLPPSKAEALEKFVNTLGLLICTFLFVYGLRATIIEFEHGTLPDKDLRIDNGYILSVFTFSFALLALEFIFRIRRADKLVEEAKTTEKASF